MRAPSAGIQSRVRWFRSSYTGLYPQNRTASIGPGQHDRLSEAVKGQRAPSELRLITCLMRYRARGPHPEGVHTHVTQCYNKRESTDRTGAQVRAQGVMGAGCMPAHAGMLRRTLSSSYTLYPGHGAMGMAPPWWAPLSSDLGTHKPVTARCWPWIEPFSVRKSARPLKLSFRSFRFFELPTWADTGNCSVERPCFLSDHIKHPCTEDRGRTG